MLNFAIVVTLAVALSTAEGRTLGAPSWTWNKLLAELMETGNTQTCCSIAIEGKSEFLDLGEQKTVGCTVYTCTKNGVESESITCKEDTVCQEGQNTIIYPNQCCQQCEGSRDEVGIFTEWEDWTPCSKSCGGGRRARKRECKIDVAAGFVECTGSILETEDCNTQGCPVNCEWEYGDYERCSKTCGEGVKKRFPIITQHPENGGRPCPPDVQREEPEVTSCNLGPCAVPCEWRWGEYGECSVSCGRGTKTRYPVIEKEAQHGGHCPQHVVDRDPDTADCNPGPCPVPCEWEWGEYGECSVTCGGGTQSRVPIITKEAQHGGYCPEHVRNGNADSTDCNTQECPPTCPNKDDNNCMINGVYQCIHDPDKDCVINDNCETVYNPDQSDDDYDRVGDACDNCRSISNSDQMNSDGDLTGNACDGDDDNDGVVDQDDNCNLIPNPTQVDSDRDGIGDECDNCKNKKNTNQADVDGDGVGNACDNCRFYPNPEQGSGDQELYGSLCTTRPRGVEIEDYENDEEEYKDAAINVDKQGLAAEIMEKLLELYYSK